MPTDPAKRRASNQRYQQSAKGPRSSATTSSTREKQAKSGKVVETGSIKGQEAVNQARRLLDLRAAVHLS
jgi:hypothetical protein